MSTPANIAAFNKQGYMQISNVAMDGYLNQGGAGNVLLTAYNNPDKVDHLMALGNLAHVGYTPEQANVFKEAGDNWSEHTGVGSTISGKDADGHYTSPNQARANRKKEDKWFNQVDNYTHAFRRDCDRGPDEDGSITKVNMHSGNYLSNALKAMNKNSKWESQYNYLYDGTKNKWYYNNPSDNKLKPLSQAVNLQDQQEAKQDYQHFKQHPTNPKLPKMNSNQIHKAIHTAIYGPKGTHGMYGLKQDYKFNQGTADADKEAIKNAKHELNYGHPSTKRAKELHQNIQIDSNSKASNYQIDADWDKMKISNLRHIDNYAMKHPDIKLYPNDLKLEHKALGMHFEKLTEQSIRQKSPKAQLAIIKNREISAHLGFGPRQPRYDGQTGAIKKFVGKFSTVEPAKPIPRSKVQNVIKAHRKDIQDTVDYYKARPKSRKLAVKTGGFATKSNIKDYFKDNRMIDMWHNQGKMTDHERDVGRFTAKNDLATKLASHVEDLAMNEGNMPDYSDDGMYHGTMQRAVGLPATSVGPISLTHKKDIKYAQDLSQKFNHLNGQINTADMYKSQGIKHHTPKIEQQLKAFDTNQVEKKANRIGTKDSKSIMSAFRELRNNGVSSDAHYNHKNNKVGEKNRRGMHNGVKPKTNPHKHISRGHGIDPD